MSYYPATELATRALVWVSSSTGQQFYAFQLASNK